MPSANINQYFKTAMMYPVDRLMAIVRGQDKSLPQTVAMMALEAKQRQQAVAQGAQAAAQPKAPTVKEQMAQELPENVGIMNLPAENMEAVGMAGGGIVAFADGGPAWYEPGGAFDQLFTPNNGLIRYERTRAPQAPSKKEEKAKKSDDKPTANNRAVYDNYLTGALGGDTSVAGAIMDAPSMAPPKANYFGDIGNAITTPFRMLVGDPSLDREKNERQRKQDREAADTRGVGMSGIPLAGNGDTRSPEVMTRRQEGVGYTNPFTGNREVPGQKQGAPAPGTGSGSGLKVSAASGSRTGGVGIGALAGDPKLEVGPAGDMDAELARIKRYMPDAKGEYAAMGAKVQAGLDKLNKEYEAGLPKGKAQEALEKILKGEEEKGKGKKDRAFNMALLNAGLAMMGGKSQYALQNIAEGALQGTKQYGEEIKDLEKAEIERGRLMASIEEARRAEARGDFKEAQARKMEAYKIATDLEAQGIKTGLEVAKDSVKTAADITNNRDTIRSADNRAQYQGAVTLQAGREQNANQLAYGRIMAQAYAGRGGDPRNIAVDNANKDLQLWLNSSSGQIEALKPGAVERKRQELLRENFRMLGLGDPFAGAGGTPAAPSGMNGFKFLGFEK